MSFESAVNNQNRMETTNQEKTGMLRQVESPHVRQTALKKKKQR